MINLKRKSHYSRTVLFLIFLLLLSSYIDWSELIVGDDSLGSLPIANAASGDVILLWDTANGAVPNGWTCISCTGGDPFYGVFPRASASYGSSTSGADTHTHALAFSTQSQGASDTGKGTSSSNKALLDTHAHTWNDITSPSGDVRPPFKNLKVIYKNNPTALPANIIAIFDTGSLPGGWTRYSTLDGNYLRGYSDNTTGGTATHTHSITASTVTSGNATKPLSDSGTGGGASTDLAHALPAANTDLTADNNAPPYLEVVFAYNSSGADTGLAVGIIAMFNATPPSGWSSVSGSAPWTNSFLKGASSYGGTGGSSADGNHGGTQALTSDASSTSLTNLGTSGASTGAGRTHTHSVTYTIDPQGSLPVYRDVIFAKRNSLGPNTPSQDSPSNGATGVSTTPTFTMTATDPNGDRLGYKVTIYSNSGCTSVVQTNEQSASSTGWTGTDSSCTASPTSCYLSGTQASYTTQSALADNTEYWWKASVKDPDGTGNYTDSSTCNSFTTVAAAVVSVSLSDGVVTYGYITPSGSRNTTSGDLNDTQTATNDGNVTETFNIKGQNTSCPWTLGASAGSDQYKHEWCTAGAGAPDPCDSSPTWNTLTTSYQQMATGIASSGTKKFDLKITVPSSTSCYTQQSADVTVQAVQE